MSLSTTERLAQNSEFVVFDEIPRHKAVFSPAQTQTADIFGFKWQKRSTYESSAMQEMSRHWLLDRYSLSGKTLADLVRGKRVLDAGCGSGHSAILLFGELLNTFDYVGVDISAAVDVARKRFQEKNLKGSFVQAALDQLPEEIGSFDIIFSEGVLHHTDSTAISLSRLVEKLNVGGLMMFYIYRKKAPIREFTDDWIRERIKPLTNEEAWKKLEPLSQLGKILGDLNVEINIPEPIEVLGIPAGKINLQRFFYWYFCKVFYRAEFSLDEMNHINFDWYRPLNCHRHTLDEVQEWMRNLNLNPLKIKEEEAGITVIAEKLAR